MTRTHIIFIVAIAAVTLALAACAGFDLGDVVQARTPQRVQQTEGLPARLSLNESQSEYEAWLQETQRTGTQWKTNLDKANQVRVVLNQLSLAAMDEFGSAIAGVPVLGPALPLLAGALGLMVRRPGDVNQKQLAKEKQASFNKALQLGLTPASSDSPDSAPNPSEPPV
ncbi:MAG: hypothetical protein ACIAXF_06220 [Phycisphaerales bacterium JB063]